MRSGRNNGNRFRNREKIMAGKTAAVILASLLLVTGCQSKYQPIETSAAQPGSSLSPAGTDAADKEPGGVIQTGNTRGPQGPITSGTVSGGTEGTSAAQGTEAAGTETGQAETGQAETEATTQAAPEFAAVDETVYITGNDVNVRSSYSSSSDVVATLNRGASVKRTGYGEEWSRVVYQEKECYIASRYLSAEAPETQAAAQPAAAEGEVRLDPNWKYAEFSKINSGAAMLYKAEGANRKGITVCVNAGHGTKGGSSVKTLCHPDGTQKVTGGSTAAGATTAAAVSSGMTFADGTAEPKVTLALALKLRAKLLAAGYDVLMIRESDDVQLDNIARTVIANNAADCHIALHWDSTTNDKGAFYMSVPGNSTYRNMEPVKSHWQQHNALGESLISGLKNAGVKIFSNGAMEMDLTQTSYSTVPSVDIELGDKVSDYSDGALETLADGLLAGVNAYFGR